MDKDQLIQKRFIDLSNMADKKSIVTFSDFLDLNDLNLFSMIKNQLFTKYSLYGGYEQAERQMIAFIPDALYYAWKYPISFIEFKPLSKKFSDDFCHRDVLGALMNLGIQRDKLGDIIVKDGIAYVICAESMADYICESLNQIRHTSVIGKVCNIEDLEYEPTLEVKEGIIASNRLDCVVSLATGEKRSDSVNLIQAAKVFVNSKLVTSNAYFCKPNDIISVRGYGKFKYEDTVSETRKGRSKIKLSIYK